MQEISGLASTLRTFNDQAREFLGFPPSVLLAVALIVAGVLVVRWRLKQRKEGWA